MGNGTAVKASKQAERQARVAEAMAGILDMVNTGDVPQAIAHHILTADPSAPSYQWSITNRMLMRRAGTGDARGYGQWQDVGRHVKRGAHAMHILAPRVVKVTEADPETGDERTATKVVGFLVVPVFRYEDTEGDELPAYTPPPVPDLGEAAAAMGIRLEYGPSVHGEYGYHVGETGRGETIHLSSNDPDTLWHELGHAAHGRLLAAEGKALVGGQQIDQEVVAEFVAATIAQITGQPAGVTGWAIRYMEAYSGSRDKLVANLMRLADTAERCVRLILEASETTTAAAA